MPKIISRQLLILIFIILLGVAVRFYKLSDFPIQLSHDEMTQLYDSISIAQTGKDIYGNFLPFIFPSIGDFKPPFYTYITSIFYMIFGGGEGTIRLPGAITGLLMIPAVYIFSLRLLKNNNIALIAAFFSSVAPFEIFFSRKSFENGAGIFLMLLGFSCIFLYFEKKRIFWMYIAGAIFAATMYTYFSHTVIIPLLLITSVIIFRKDLQHSFSKLLGPILLFLFLILPLLILIFINSDTRFRSQTVFIKQDVNLGRELDFVQTNNLFLDNFFKVKITVDYIFNRYLKQFGPIYLFSNGLDFTNQSLLGIGPLFLIQLPFLMLGIIYLLSRSELNMQNKFIAAWIILGMLPSSLTFENFSPHRVVMVFTMLDIISAAGLYWFIKFAKNSRQFFYPLMIFFIIAFVFNFMYFLHMYFVNYPYEKSQYLQYPFKQVAQYAWSQYHNFDTIVFDPKFGDIAPGIGVGAHYYFAYYGNIPPAKFQQELHSGNKPRELIFDTFSIREVYWPSDKEMKKTLIIVSPWSVPESDIKDNKIIKRFYFYNGKLAFYAIKL